MTYNIYLENIETGEVYANIASDVDGYTALAVVGDMLIYAEDNGLDIVTADAATGEIIDYFFDTNLPN